jgi:hypothetical protein
VTAALQRCQLLMLGLRLLMVVQRTAMVQHPAMTSGEPHPWKQSGRHALPAHDE